MRRPRLWRLNCAIIGCAYALVSFLIGTQPHPHQLGFLLCIGVSAVAFNLALMAHERVIPRHWDHHND